MDNINVIKNIIQEHREVIDAFDESRIGRISEAVDVIVEALKKGGKILICGNGGSAADSQHMAAEFVNRFLMERTPLPAVALSTDTSVLTSIANDYGFKEVFKKQVAALGSTGDVLIGISTSGDSENIVQACRTAKETGMKTVAFTGALPNRLADTTDICIDVPSKKTPRVQEMHLTIIHMLCDLVERKLFK